ncbi:P-loop containing nucleoside triphosphate hydrolase protein [Xylaria nigripes]|nr:P-loop containing nucleoside triphosphate hydrolase protein [Xylaria nigripes]
MMDSDTFVTTDKSDLSFSTNKSFEYRVPSARSFSFSVSGFWKPTKDPFLQWIGNIPDPLPRDDTLEPARYHTLKHSLDHEDSDDDRSNLRRSKRTKLSSVTGNLPVAESRHSKLSITSRGLVRRVSSAYQRVVTPILNRNVSQKTDFSRAATPVPEPTPSCGTPSFMLIDRPKMRFVFVGDAECGKTSVLERFYRNSFSLRYNPTQYELYHKVTAIDGQDVDIELWDTSGDIALEQLSRLSYLAWDCVFLCFSVNSVRSFNNARTQWIAQIRRFTRGAPLILVGTKTDQRVGPSLWAPLYPNLEPRVTATEGAMTATAVGATRYVECSAMTRQGIDGVFEEGVRTVNQARDAVKPLETPTVNHFSGLAEMLCFK